jgi:hypothetical protein
MELKRWREENCMSQSEALLLLNEAAIEVALDSLQNWETVRWNPRAQVALPLADYLRENPKFRRKPARQRGQSAKDNRHGINL